MENKRIGLSRKERGTRAKAVLSFLKSRIKGQNPILKSFVKCIEAWESGLRRQDKPIYRGLFLGLPKVGKRLFVESLAECLFGDKAAFTEIRCGCFNEETAASVPDLLCEQRLQLPLLAKETEFIARTKKLQGIQEATMETQGKIIALGYASIGEAHVDDPDVSPELPMDLPSSGKRKPMDAALLVKELAALTEQHRAQVAAMGEFQDVMIRLRMANPVSIVLFSDIDRSCRGLFHVIQQLLETGKAVFPGGREVDLTNSFVFATSTENSEIIIELLKKRAKKGDKLGFVFRREEDLERLDQEIYNAVYKDSLRDMKEDHIHLGQLSQFDRVSVFRPLFRDSLGEILERELQKFQTELASSFPVILHMSGEVKEFLLDESEDKPELGASTLLAKMDKYIRREVSRLVMLGEVDEGDEIFAELAKEGKEKDVVFFRAERPGKATDEKQ